MTMLLKAMGSDERRNKDLVHVVGMPPHETHESMPSPAKFIL